MPAVSINIQFSGFEPFQHAGQFFAAVRRVHGHAEDARVGHQLFASTDSIAIRADQRQIRNTVLQAPARGELGDGGGLARAGGADHAR